MNHFNPSIITTHGYVLSHLRFITTQNRVLIIPNSLPIGKLCFITYEQGNPNKFINAIFSQKG